MRPVELEERCFEVAFIVVETNVMDFTFGIAAEIELENCRCRDFLGHVHGLPGTVFKLNGVLVTSPRPRENRDVAISLEQEVASQCLGYRLPAPETIVSMETTPAMHEQ